MKSVQEKDTVETVKVTQLHYPVTLSFARHLNGARNYFFFFV